jgi:hypothetical protein
MCYTRLQPKQHRSLYLKLKFEVCFYGTCVLVPYEIPQSYKRKMFLRSQETNCASPEVLWCNFNHHEKLACKYFEHINEYK